MQDAPALSMPEKSRRPNPDELELQISVAFMGKQTAAGPAENRQMAVRQTGSEQSGSKSMNLVNENRSYL